LFYKLTLIHIVKQYNDNHLIGSINDTFKNYHSMGLEKGQSLKKKLMTGTADFSLTQLQLWMVGQNDYMKIYFRYIFMVTVISKLRTLDMCMLQN
jgi:hypothetical protein